METTAADVTQTSRYQIQRPLGAGGMGIVYLAQDRKLQRPVAIKKLRSEAASENAQARIQSEGQLLAKLNHRNIVQLYDVLEEDGQLALVMEYVEGANLREWMRERNASLREKLGLLTQICEGLAEAHALGIIHRDLKPDNILITPSGTAKITDFGIAKSQHQELDLTREDHVAGTVSAMSPEQIQGKALDARSDLFSFGTIAYELLCGKRPFDRDEGGSLAMANRIVNEAHVPPQQAWPDIPEPLAALLDKLLNKNPDARPQSTQLVCQALELLYQQGPDTNNTEYTRTITQLLQRPRRKTWRTAAAVLSLVVVIGISSLWLWKQPEQPPEILAIVPVAFTGEELPEASRNQLEAVILDAIRENIFSRDRLYLSAADRAAGVDYQNFTNYLAATGATRLVQPIISCQKNSCDAVIRFINQKGFVFSETQRKFLPRDIIDLQSTISLSFSRGFHTYSAPTKPLTALEPKDQEAYLTIFRNMYIDFSATQEDIKDLQELLTKYPYQEKLFALLIDALTSKFEINKDKGLLDQAKKTLAFAESRINNKYLLTSLWAQIAVYDHGLNFDQILAQLASMGEPRQNIFYLSARKHIQSGDMYKALSEIEHALAYTNDTKSLHLKAEILMWQGNYAEATETLDALLKTAPNDIKALNLYGPIALLSGNINAAIDTFEKLLKQSKNHYLYNNLGIAYALKGEYEKSRKNFKESLKISPDYYNSIINLADLELEKFNREHAINLYKKYLHKYKNRQDVKHLIFQSQAYAAIGDKTSSTRTLYQGIQQSGDDPFHSYNIALAQLRLGDTMSAIVSLEKALENGLSPTWIKLPSFDRICNLSDIHTFQIYHQLHCPRE